MTSSSEGFIDVAGGTLWYKFSKEVIKKVPLVVLHGGPGVPHDYLDSLSQLNRPVVLYDQLGCGRSPLKANVAWTVEKFVDDLAVLIEHLGLKKFHLMGHSWGGSLAIEYYIKFPLYVQSLILASPLISTPLWIKEARRLLQQLPKEIVNNILEHEKLQNFDSHQYQTACQVFYQNFVCRMAVWPKCLEESFSQLNMAIYQSMWGPSEFTVTGNLLTYSRLDDLSSIKVPALITCGRYDEATPESMKEAIARIPQGVLKIFEKSAHMAHLEETEDFLNTIETFVEGAERGLPSQLA